MSAAIDQKLMQDELDHLLQQMLSESGGPLTRAEFKRAREALDGPSIRQRKRNS